MMPKLPCGKNLISDVLELGEPWTFTVTEEALEIMRDKKKRRKEMSDPATEWNVYSGFAGGVVTLRINKENPAKWMYALVVDYDRGYTIEEIRAKIDEHYRSDKRPGEDRPIPRPNLVERTLSGNARLTWLFERPVGLPTPQFFDDLYELLRERLQFDMILLGYDKNSEKPEQLWTNSGEWYVENETPVKWEWLLGLTMEVSKKAAHEGTLSIPLELIAEEVTRRYPGRWKGKFELDATGVRFWDEKADNPAGCQIKYDGMLCFTGPFPFRSWADILGTDWVKNNQLLNTGKIIEEFRYAYKDRDYYQLENGIWTSMSKEDVIMRLRNRGVSGKIPKGEKGSQMDEVVEMIQSKNKVLGVGPIVSRPSGVIIHKGEQWINTANIQVVQAVRGSNGNWSDCPFICRIEQGFNTDKRGIALATLRAWHLRSWQSQRDFKRLMGQAAFICGAPNTGKTLYATHIFCGSLGGKYANPFRYFTGQTNFNIQLFGCPVLMVNDEEAPSTDAERRKLHARIKSSVVNPTQEIEAKFHTPEIVDWTGRIIWTLNDDAGDVYQFPEVTPSIEDKVMFFRVLNTGIVWPERDEIEATIAKELPHYLWCLENIFEPPKEILQPGRMGVKSYFDPVLRRWSMQNTDAYSILELLEQWIKIDPYWINDDGSATENEQWVGPAAELLAALHMHDQLKPLLQGITSRSLPKSLTSLSKLSHTGVSIDLDSRRHFVIHRGLAEQE